MTKASLMSPDEGVSDRERRGAGLTPALAQHGAGNNAAPFLDDASQPWVVTPVRSDSGKFNPHPPMVEA
jgi:hypothetical protein